MLGGRVAEEITFESVTSGASNDLERVTTIARKMVCEWGMSDKIGPLTFGEKEGEVFLGRDMGHVKNYSEATAVAIDNEIRRIVHENYEITQKLLKDHEPQLIALSELLLEKETLDAGEIIKVVFPDGAPDYLKAKVEEAEEESGFVAEPVESEPAVVSAEPQPTEAAPTETSAEDAKSDA